MIDPSSAKEIRAFRADLKAVDAGFPKMFTKVNKAVADLATTAATGAARGGNKMQQAAAKALKPRATQAVAAVTVRTANAPMANPAFFGLKRRTGWYAHINSPNGKPQAKAWVGSSWTAGVKGEGPYLINDAVAEVVPRVVDEWGRGVDDLTRRAFPGK